MEYRPRIHLLQLLLLIILGVAMPLDASHFDDLRPILFEEPQNLGRRQLTPEIECQSTTLPDQVNLQISFVLPIDFGTFKIVNFHLDRRVADTVSLLNRGDNGTNFNYCEVYRYYTITADPPDTQILIQEVISSMTLTQNDDMTGPFLINNKLDINIDGTVYQTTYLKYTIRVGEPQTDVREFIVQPPQALGDDTESEPDSLQPVFYSAYDGKKWYETAEFVKPGIVVVPDGAEYQLDFQREVLVKGVLILTSSNIDSFENWYQIDYFMVSNTNEYQQCTSESNGYTSAHPNESYPFSRQGAAFNCNKTGTKFVIHIAGEDARDPTEEIAFLFTSVRIWTEEIVSINAEHLLQFDSTTSNSDDQMRTLYRTGSFNNRDDQIVISSANSTIIPVLALKLPQQCKVSQVLIIFYDEFDVSPEGYKVAVTDKLIDDRIELDLDDNNLGFTMEQSLPLTFVTRHISGDSTGDMTPEAAGEYVTLFRNEENSELRIAKIVVVGTPFCLNTDNCALDSSGGGCVTYGGAVSHECSSFDTIRFNSSKMCCYCGGGITRAIATGDSLNGEEACANHGYSETECSAVGCCHWDCNSEKCQSDVYSGVCPSTCAAADNTNTCIDQDNGAQDETGDSCNSYQSNWCGSYDTDNFVSSVMCCTCGGGQTPDDDNPVDSCLPQCLNTDNCAVDSVQDGCEASYDGSSPHDCGLFDTDSFSSSKMCCHCGGGTTRPFPTGASLNGEEACQNHEYSESECLAVGCCHWNCDDMQCYSSVDSVCRQTSGPSACHYAYGCIDQDNGAVDDDLDTCIEYNTYWCGGSNTDTFDSNEMCCACDGGYTPVHDDDPGDSCSVQTDSSDADLDLEPEPEGQYQNNVELSVFDQSIQMLNLDFGFGIIPAQIGATVQLNLSLLEAMNDNDEFGAPLELITDLKGAASFIDIDESQATMTISPKEEQEADYYLLMKLTDGTQHFQKTVHLRVATSFKVDQLTQGQSQYKGNESKGDNAKEEEPPINILRGATYTLNLKDHVSFGGGTTLNKIELLELATFSDFDEDTLTIKLTPDDSTEIGAHPFIVEVINADGSTDQFQITIMVVDNPQQADSTIVQLRNNEMEINIGAVSTSVSVEEFTTNSGAITDILQSDGILELEVEERQALFDSLLQQKYHVLELQTEEEEDEDHEDNRPEAVVGEITVTGECVLYFNTNMAGPTILSDNKIGLSTQGRLSSTDSQQDSRRLQVSEQTFDLSNYLSFEIQRGDEDSADGEDLAFQVASEQISNDRLNFRLSFENPLKVSIGTRKDIMIITIVDDKFFKSQKGSSGLTLKKGFTIRNLLPKMVSGDSIVLEYSESSMSTATQAIVVTQLVITITMAVSLKALWNLMNIVQVLAYIRFYTDWPTRMMLVFEYADNAITLRPISQPIFNYGKTQFEIANSTLANENLMGLGVQDGSLIQSLGVFLLVAVAILILVLLLLLIKNCCKNIQNPTVKSIQQKLEDKLFYNSFLRYMLVSNLKLTYTLWAFFVAFFSYRTIQESIQTTAFMMTIIFLMVWPIFIARLMFKNQQVLMHQSFFKKFSTLYQEIRTDSKKALLYNVMFCARRFDIVVINVFFSQNAFVTNFDNNHYLFKIVCFLFIQSIYVDYILYAKPHTRIVYNWLEIFNETVLILLSYIMICYCGIGDRHLKAEIQEAAFPEIVSLIIVAIIVIINVFVMVKLTVTKMILSYKQKKQLQKHQEAQLIAQSEPTTPVTTFRSNMLDQNLHHQPASTLLVNNIKLEDDQQRKMPYMPGKTLLLPHIGDVDKEQILNSQRGGMGVVHESEEDKWQNDENDSSNSEDSLYRPNQNMEPSRYGSTEIVASSILIRYDAPSGPTPKPNNNQFGAPKGSKTKGFDPRNVTSSLSDLCDQPDQEHQPVNSILHTFEPLESQEERERSKTMKTTVQNADGELLF